MVYKNDLMDQDKDDWMDHKKKMIQWSMKRKTILWSLKLQIA